MGLIKNIRKMLEQPEPLGYERTYKAINRGFNKIERDIDDPDDRLEPFKALKKDIDEALEHNTDIQEAIRKVDTERDGWASHLQPKNVSITALVIISFVCSTTLPFMASLLPIYISGAVLAGAAGLMTIGNVALHRRRAKELGLSVSDVKYALKLNGRQARVERIIKHISTEDDTKLHLATICEKYNKSSEPKRAKGRHRIDTIPAQTSAARNAPADHKI